MSCVKRKTDWCCSPNNFGGLESLCLDCYDLVCLKGAEPTWSNGWLLLLNYWICYGYVSFLVDSLVNTKKDRGMSKGSCMFSHDKTPTIYTLDFWTLCSVQLNATIRFSQTLSKQWRFWSDCMNVQTGLVGPSKAYYLS